MTAKSPIIAYKVSTPTVLRAKGEDAGSFLQSQFSADLRKLAEIPAVYGLWLDRKGKVLADSTILQHSEEEYYLISECSSAEVIREHLEAHIIADDVELEDISSGYDLYVLSSAREEDDLQPHIGSGTLLPPRNPDAASFRYLLVPRGEEIAVSLQSKEEYSKDRILAKLPLVPEDIGPNDLPQEGKMETYAVSFNKGCYLGQEVMARLHSMGKPQRSVERVRIEGSSSTGEAIQTAGKNVGDLRSATSDGAYTIGLALLKSRFLEGHVLTTTKDQQVAIIT